MVIELFCALAHKFIWGWARRWIRAVCETPEQRCLSSCPGWSVAHLSPEYNSCCLWGSPHSCGLLPTLMQYLGPFDFPLTLSRASTIKSEKSPAFFFFFSTLPRKIFLPQPPRSKLAKLLYKVFLFYFSSLVWSLFPLVVMDGAAWGWVHCWPTGFCPRKSSCPSFPFRTPLNPTSSHCQTEVGTRS